MDSLIRLLFQGGVGKTMLTGAVVRDERVRRAFGRIACESERYTIPTLMTNYLIRDKHVAEARSSPLTKTVVSADSCRQPEDASKCGFSAVTVNRISQALCGSCGANLLG